MSIALKNMLIQAFKEGQVLGLDEHGIKPEHIQTFISDVFLFPSTVYKIYKRDNESFNKDFTDLSDPQTRQKFYEEDFKWNHYFNPSVYQRLMGIEARGEQVALTSEVDSCPDLVIQMRRIDATANLTKSLLQNRLSSEDMASLGYQLTKAIDLFPWRGPQKVPILKQFETMMRDVELWSSLAEPALPRALTDKTMRHLRSYVQDHEKEFLNLSDEEFVIGMDNHSDNIFFEDGKLSLIDIFPPKIDWRFIERSYSIYRVSADLEILGGKALAEAFIEGCTQYPKMKQQLHREKRDFYQLYSALIKAPYLFFLLEKTPERKYEAELYKAFIEEMVR